MKSHSPLLALLLGSSLPAVALAATIDASTLPNGTYTVTVERVVDATHVQVKLDTGSETTLAAGRASVNFSKVQQNDQLKLSLINGTVMVYADLSNH